MDRLAEQQEAHADGKDRDGVDKYTRPGSADGCDSLIIPEVGQCGGECAKVDDAYPVDHAGAGYVCNEAVVESRREKKRGSDDG